SLASQVLLTGSRDGTAKLWDIGSGGLIGSFGSPIAGRPVNAAFADAGRKVVLTSVEQGRGPGGFESAAVVYERATGKLLQSFRRRSPWPRSVNVTPDATRVLTSETNEKLTLLWDLASGRQTGRIERTNHTAFALAMSGDSRQVFLDDGG